MAMCLLLWALRAAGVALAGDGADVALTWLDAQTAAEGVAARIREAGRRVHLVRADVARLPDVEVICYEGMPHNICDSLPDRCVDDVLAFLRRRFGGA